MPEDAVLENPITLEEEKELVTPEAAASWLAAVRPAAVLALLREPEFAEQVYAFSGFRVNAAGYANPLVRRRLAQQAAKDEKFADRLRAMAIDAALKPAVDTFKPSATAADTPTEPPADDKEQHTLRAERDGLRTERDQRRRERDEARVALASAQTARAEAEAARRRAEEERDELRRQIEQKSQRLARLERQAARLRTEQMDLLRALEAERHPRPLPAPAAPAVPVAPALPPAASPWLMAAIHLLDKNRYEMALTLAEDVLRSEPEEITALKIAAVAQDARGDARQALAVARRLLYALLARGQTAEAADALQRLLLLLALPEEAEKDARHFLSAIRAGDSEGVEATQAMLARLRGLAPEAHEWLARQIESIPPLVAILMPEPGALAPDDPLPLDVRVPALTALRLHAAILTGDAGTVEDVRAALAQLEQSDPETRQRIVAALRRAAEGDTAPQFPLLRAPRSAAVVDASNAAWFDQESLAHGKPRLRPLLEMRRTLWQRGYFPVVLIADAPLPYTIDEPDVLREMALRGEVTLVDSGVVADEALLREAKRLGAPLITNDYMTDWDPNGEVEKIRFTISNAGPVHLLS